MEEGASLGAFSLERELGAGSSSRVFVAREAGTNLLVALKWLEDETFTPNLKSEFRTASRLRHPNLAAVHELHVTKGGAYFTMELIDGETLTEYSRRPRVEGALDIRGLFSQLADGLDHLHEAGLVHRDIKPENILIGATGRVTLVDLGLAEKPKVFDSRGFSGTLAYAAPERLRGGAATRATDWFAFGVLMFEILAGELPEGPVAAMTIQASLEGRRLRSASNIPGIPGDLAALIDGLVDPDPATRMRSAAVFEQLGRPRRWAEPTRLLGRETEKAWLNERLCSHEVTAIVGDAGTGKTSLARVALGNLGAGTLLLHSRCSPREQIPFNGLDGIATELLDFFERTAITTTPAARLIEAVFGRVNHQVPNLTSSEVADALHEMLVEATKQSRVVLFIDDVQWMDEDSRPVLKQLIEKDERSTVLFAARHAWEHIPALLRPARECCLTLERLDDDAGMELLAALAPELPDATRLELVDLAAGRPLVLEAGAKWASTHQGSSIPVHVAELLRRSLSTDSTPHDALLRALAVHEHSLSMPTIEQLEGATPRLAYDLLDRGVVEFERKGTDYLVRLKHQELAATFASALDERTRRSQHLLLATAIEATEKTTSTGRARDSDSLFRHWQLGGRPKKAELAAARSAVEFEERLAFHMAATRLRWLIDEGVNVRPNTKALARVLSRAGNAQDAASVHLQVASDALADEANTHRRLAAENLLRSGDISAGTHLLERCLADASIPVPPSRGGKVAGWARARISTRIPGSVVTRTPTETEDRQIELRWSGGLGLSLVDLFGSALHQAEYTSMAFRVGRPDQVIRALAVEYSFTSVRGGLGAQRRLSMLRDALNARSHIDAPYAHAMADLSWAAGDYFGGRLEGSRRRIVRARQTFEGQLGALSWELANCAMYEAWIALLEGDLEYVATAVPKAFTHSGTRGDHLYRQCFLRGFSATAWLAAGRVDELEAHLDNLPRPEGEFQIAHFLELLARQQIDHFRGDFRLAWKRVSSLIGNIVRSGFLLMRWPCLCVTVLIVQAALGSDDSVAQRTARRWLRVLRLQSHPAARPWWCLLSAELKPNKRDELLAQAAHGFAALGMTLLSRCARDRRAGIARRGVAVQLETAVCGPSRTTRR